MNTKKYISVTMVLGAIAGLAMAIPAFADTNNTPANRPNGAWQGQVRGNRGQGQDGMMKPAIAGTVSAVNGNILTVTGRQGFNRTPNADKNAVAPATASATVTFTVDATNVTVVKNNATSTVSSIAVGDTVVVQGTLTGTNIVATMIRDGIMGGPDRGIGRQGENASSTPIVGNGEPVVAGTVSSVSGTTLVITNKSNVQYTIDASNASFLQGQKTISLSDVKVGDTVLAQGTVNGTSVTASTLIDQTKPANTGNGQQKHLGFFGGIGQFFMHLFGF